MSEEIIKHIIFASSWQQDFYYLLTAYPEIDPIARGGSILHTTDSAPGITTLLTSNEPLSAIWVSPERSIWACSSNGTVWTTASVEWQRATIPDLEYEVMDKRYPWTYTLLPVAKAGSGPVLQVLWGTNDRDVHTSCLEGSIYHWNGSTWTEHADLNPLGFNDMHGDGSDNIYAVGENAGIAHFDGTIWRRVAAPAEIRKEALTGVHVMQNGETIICSRGGSILRGGAGGFELLGKYDARFYGITSMGERILLAAGDDGCWELTGNRASQIKDRLSLAGAFAVSKDAALFVETIQKPDPSVIRFRPTREVPWTRFSFN